MLKPPLRVAVLTTHKAPGLDSLLQHPDRGVQWDLVGVMASVRECRERALVEKAGVSFVVRDLRAFCRARGARWSDLGARGTYDLGTIAHLRLWRAELVILVGYLHIVTEPLLARFPERVVNLHDADLTIRGPGGVPTYRGLRSTRDAIVDGVAETRTTAHLVTAEVDEGPLLFRSWAFPTHPLLSDARRLGDVNTLKRQAYLQREWMMSTAWGPLLAAVVEAFAGGNVRVVDHRAFVRESEGPIDLPEPVEAAPPLRRAAAGATR
jgi:folate-dependent phosphoribosylglycinamide formyltransferase PurN